MDFPIPHRPLVTHIEITDACNENCSYCFQRFRSDKNFTYDSPRGPIVPYNADRSSSPETVAAIVDKISREDGHTVNFTGGEPLLRRDLLYSGLKAAKESDVFSSVNTNGSLIGPNDIDAFETYGLDYLLVSFPSLDSATAEAIIGVKGGFDRITRGLRLAAGRSFDLYANMVVDKRNVDAVFDTGKFLVDNFGIGSFSATPLLHSRNTHTPLLLGQDELVWAMDQLLEVKRQLGVSISTVWPIVPCALPEPHKYSEILSLTCGCGIWAVTLDGVGNVRPSSAAHLSYGNILSDDYDVILERMSPWRDRLSPNGLTPKECSGCAELLSCRGGCRTEAYSVNGRLDGANPHMTSPLDKPVPRRHPVGLEDAGKRAKIARKIFVRQESEEWFTLAMPHHWIPVRQIYVDVVTFLYQLYGYSEFETAKAKSVLEIDGTVFDTALAVLAKHGFVTISSREVKK